MISLPTSDQVPELMISAFLGFLTGAAANALAELVGAELSADYIIPRPFDPRVCKAVAAAVAKAARDCGVARI